MDPPFNHDSEFSASHSRIVELLEEARTICASFRASIWEDSDLEKAAELAWQFCVVTQNIQMSLPGMATAYAESYREVVLVLEEFIVQGSSFISDLLSSKRSKDVSFVKLQQAVDNCIHRCERVHSSLEWREHLQSMYWRVNPARTDLGGQHLSDDLAAEPDDNFQLLERVKGGYYGVVWKARQLRPERIVAAKIIRPSMRLYSSALEHAQALARLSHPNVVTVHTVAQVREPDTNELTHAVIMEWLDGLDLESRIKASSTFQFEEAQRICCDILRAIQAMHGAGLTHGDLHAGNVVVLNGCVKVIDIKYSESQTLALLSGGNRESRIQDDIDAFRRLAVRVLSHTDADLREINRIEAGLRHSKTLEDSFTALSPAVQQDY